MAVDPKIPAPPSAVRRSVQRPADRRTEAALRDHLHRRDFLTKTAAGLGAAGAFATGLGFARDAHAAKTPKTIIVQSKVLPELAEAWSRCHRPSSDTATATGCESTKT